MKKEIIINELKKDNFTTMRCGRYFIINLKYLKVDLETILRRILGLRELKNA